MPVAKIVVEFQVPETEDKCWTPDGVQCFYDSVLKQAHFSLHSSLMKAVNDATMTAHYQRYLDVVNSIKVSDIRMFDT